MIYIFWTVIASNRAALASGAAVARSLSVDYRPLCAGDLVCLSRRWPGVVWIKGAACLRRCRSCCLVPFCRDAGMTAFAGKERFRFVWGGEWEMNDCQIFNSSQKMVILNVHSNAASKRASDALGRPCGECEVTRVRMHCPSSRRCSNPSHSVGIGEVFSGTRFYLWHYISLFLEKSEGIPQDILSGDPYRTSESRIGICSVTYFYH
jgi:hypothetical protein